MVALLGFLLGPAGRLIPSCCVLASHSDAQLSEVILTPAIDLTLGVKCNHMRAARRYLCDRNGLPVHQRELDLFHQVFKLRLRTLVIHSVRAVSICRDVDLPAETTGDSSPAEHASISREQERVKLRESHLRHKVLRGTCVHLVHVLVPGLVHLFKV